MIHQITIDQELCHGLINCRECEKIMPGLLGHCMNHGELNIEEWAMTENSARISQVLVACDQRAIMLRPL